MFIAYNDILRNIANDKCIYFADIFSRFEKISIVKNIYEDVTVNYIHHSSDWGHEIYMSEILLVFNVDEQLNLINIENYVY